MPPHVLAALALSALANSAWAADVLSPSLDRKDLLLAACPEGKGGGSLAAGPRPGVRLAPIDLPDVAWPALEGTDSDTTTVEIVPLNVIRLDERHAVMVTRTRPWADDGHPACIPYNCPFAIGVYFYTRAKGGWALSRRLEAAARESTADEPQTHVVAWPGHGFLMSVSVPDAAQGESADRLLLMGLEPDQAWISESLPLSWQNLSSSGTDCQEVLRATFKPSRRQTVEPSLDCHVGEGRWRIDGDAIVVHYQQTTRSADAHGHLLPLETLTEDVRLVPRQGRLEVVSGSLPRWGI